MSYQKYQPIEIEMPAAAGASSQGFDSERTSLQVSAQRGKLPYRLAAESPLDQSADLTAPPYASAPPAQSLTPPPKSLVPSATCSPPGYL